MKATLILQASDRNKIELLLNQNMKSITNKDFTHIVYQDEQYNLYLNLEEISSRIKNIELILNNETVNARFVNINNDKDESYEAILTNDGKIFGLTYGITEFMLHFEYDNNYEEYYFSEPLAVAINKQYEESIDSIYEMLNDIYNKNHHLLFQPKIQNNSEIPKFLKNKDSKYDEEINIIKVIAQNCVKNLPYFMQSPKYATISDLRVDYVEKLNVIGRENIQYIVTHPEELKLSYGASGIRINKQQMIPAKTLVSSNKYTYNIEENKAVVSFIKTLMEHINVRCEQLSNFIKLNEISLLFVESLKEDYVLSSKIIQQYIKFAFGNYLDEYRKLQSQFSHILMKYKNALPCDVSILYGVSKPTPVFLEIYHYRNIYQMMNIWFGRGNIKIPSRNILLQFANADQIYEYYCLLNIYDVFISLGFIEEESRRCAYKYDVKHPKFENTIEDNTFFFKKGDTEVVLYYQPVIYSNISKTDNSITLTRTDKCFFTPDFIVKKVCDGEITYGIIDAKWRNRNTLLTKGIEGGFQDMVYKYFYSVVDRGKGFKNVDFLWLLQGKDDQKENSLWIHRNGIISSQNDASFRYHSGIARFTPKSGTMELKQILSAFLKL